MKKFRKIKRLGHRSTNGILDNGDLVVLEKLDGNNFRVTFDQEHERLLFGSRNVEFKEDGVPHRYDSSEIGGQFEDVAEYIHDTIDDREALSSIVLFGENMVKHTLEYNWEAVPQWLVFAAFDQDENQWLSWGRVEEIADRLGFDTVPVVNESLPVDEFKDRFDPEDPDEFVPVSRYRNGDKLAEGVVLRNRENGMMAKIRTDQFKEKHEGDSGMSGAKMPNDTADLVGTYTTRARIKKHIDKLVVDEGNELEMALMEQLPMRVVDDIFEEEYDEMVRSNKTIDFKQFRSLVANRCVKVLKDCIRSEAMNNE